MNVSSIGSRLRHRHLSLEQCRRKLGTVGLFRRCNQAR
jgi:hypothetical protein